MMKNTKGITLVTLVITIIILLILAGVAINTLTQTGLLENAKQAKSIVQNAEKLENQILVNYEKNIGEYITGQRDGSSNKVVLYDNVQGDVSGTLSQSINDFDFIIVDSPAGIEQGFTYASSIADEAIIVVNLDLATLRDNDRVIGLLLKKGIQDLKLIINKVNLDDIEDGKSLTIDDALDILSLPLLGIVYEDHEMIEANNKGRPVYLLKGHLLHDCFDNIAHRLLGHKRAFAKCKRRGLLSRIFLG